MSKVYAIILSVLVLMAVVTAGFTSTAVQSVRHTEDSTEIAGEILVGTADELDLPHGRDNK